MTTANFRARITIEDDNGSQIEAWDDELSPFVTDGRLAIREWAVMHFQNCYSEKDLRDVLGVPAEGNFEVLLTATIRSTYDEWSQEHDEELDIKEIKHQQIPDSWYEATKA
jgi:hypothetical protein